MNSNVERLVPRFKLPFPLLSLPYLDVLDMVVINVCKDTKEAAKDSVDCGAKRFGKGSCETGRKDGVVLELGLDPLHERKNVFAGRNVLGLACTVTPKVFVFGSRAHRGTAFLGAKVHKSGKKHVDLKKKLK